MTTKSFVVLKKNGTIKSFKTVTEKETRIHEVIEKEEIIIPKIHYSHPNSIPKNLLKYYRPDKLGFSVLKEKRIWATNPLHFNDPFDCSSQLWDLATFPVDEMKRFLNEFLPNGVKTNIHIMNLRKIFTELFLRFIGVYCLNDESNNDLFWGYYNEHKGFSITYNTEVLNSYWGMKPLKVEYAKVESFEKISFVIEELYNQNIISKVIRWATLKKEEWIHEDEWRYVFLDINLANTNRLKEYPEGAISEIVFGYKYFPSQDSEHVADNSTKYCFGGDLKENYSYQVLKFLKEKKNLTLKRIDLKEDFSLAKRRIHIGEIRNNHITIIHE